MVMNLTKISFRKVMFHDKWFLPKNNFQTKERINLFTDILQWKEKSDRKKLPYRVPDNKVKYIPNYEKLNPLNPNFTTTIFILAPASWKWGSLFSVL